MKSFQRPKSLKSMQDETENMNSTLLIKKKLKPIHQENSRFYENFSANVFLVSSIKHLRCKKHQYSRFF